LHADDVNILGGRVHTVKKRRGFLLVFSKEIGLKVNADKTKYMVTSRGSECRTKSQYKDSI